MLFLRPLAVLLMLLPLPARAVVLFQLETFDSPTGWTVGKPTHPSPPSIQPDTGPLGTGDSSLRIVASPVSGPGSRLAVINESDWTGDYLGAGISSLTMDLRNQSPNLSVIRVGIEGPGGRFVTEGKALGEFSTWTSVEYELTASSLISAGGTDVNATLADVTQIRIIHSATADFQGGPGFRTVFVDNIRAVPEPGSLLLLALGLVFLNCRKR